MQKISILQQVICGTYSNTFDYDNGNLLNFYSNALKNQDNVPICRL